MPQLKGPFYEIRASADESAEVFLYGNIGDDYWSDNDAKGFIEDLKSLGDVKHINCRIHSNGGSVSSGIAIYNALVRHPATVTTHNDGMAASIASLIYLAGDERQAPSNAMFMVHDPWTVVAGNAADLRKYADILDTTKKSMLAAYTERTGLSDDEMSDLLSNETWLTAEDAKTFGFVTEVSESVRIAASLDTSMFKHTPQAFIPQAAGAVEPPKEINMPKTDPAAPVAVKTEVELKAELVLAETSRKTEIKAAFEPFKADHPELLAECLDSMEITPKQASDKLLAAIGEKSKVEPIASDVRIVADVHDKARKGMGEVLAARSGLGEHDSSNDFRSYTLLDMARATLALSNVNMAGMNKMDLVAAAFTHNTGDFTSILSTTANKAMLKGFDAAEETFDKWTSVGNLSDFKQTSRVDLNAFPGLAEVPENGEYSYATIGDKGETVQLLTYGKLFGITRQAIINDDLDAFSKVPARMGRAAKRKIGDLAYAVLTGNPTMGDSVSLFHLASHGNLPTGAALSAASLAAAKVLMRKQKDASGSQFLNVNPAYFIVPVALEETAFALMNDSTAVGQTNSAKKNPHQGMAQVIADPRLDASSATAWYLAANPHAVDTVEIQYLDGNQSPFLDQQAGWSIDGVDFKVRIDVGAKALGYQGLLKNVGA